MTRNQQVSRLLFSWMIVHIACGTNTVRAQCSSEQQPPPSTTALSGNSATSEASSKSIVCHLKALDGTGGLDFLTQGNAPAVERLRIQCSERFLFESELPRNLFTNWASGLKQLTVDACKLHKLPRDTLNGLGALKVLNMHTRNAEWGAGKSLELQRDSFQSLSSVEVLNLADNNLRGIAEGSFCELTTLQVLNVTRNRIRSTDTLGFSQKPCQGESDLKILDISHNELVTVPENWGVSKLRRLQQLNLEHNNITEISEDALAGLVSLRIFNISHNMLDTVPSGLFAGARDIQEIHLQHNRLFEIPKGLFHRLEQLLILDLSGNQVSSHHIDNTTFSGLIRLIVLNLSHNAVTRIDAKTFKDLYFLQILDLRNNSIGYIDDNTFLPLYNLHTLNLAENRLHTINDELFNGLFVLSKLTLNNNLISSIEPSAFRNCSDLKELDLSTNQLTDIPIAIQNLSMLRTLDLGENQITEIGEDSFKSLTQLTGLRMIDNQIGNITVAMFSDLPRLSVLNLAKNRIQNVERGSFDQNPEVEALRLDKNFISDVNGVFSTMNSLLWLNLGENHLVWFDYAFIPKNLKWLDLHGNYITELGNYYKLQEEIKLKTLDGSHNRITELGPMSVPNSVELLFVNNNFIETVHANTFVDKTNLTRVDLYSNSLSKIHMHTLRLAPIPATKPLPEFYLGGNPFECDCSMDWLQTINSLTTRQHPRIMDAANIECIMPHARGAPVRPLTTLTTEDFLCRYETHCFALCHCCDFDACDCEMTCPTNCTCYHDQTWKTNVVDCGGHASTELPRKVPMDTTILYLDGNVMPELKNNTLLGRKNLRSLFVNSSAVARIQKRTFAGLQSIEIVHLENNLLTALQGHEFDNLPNVRHMYLQNNLIESIANDTFAAMLSTLQVLRIDGNRLSAMPVWRSDHHPLTTVGEVPFPHMRALTIGRNSWSCRCSFLRQLTAFVADNALIIEDAQDIYCVDGVVKHELDFNSSSDCSGFYEGRSVLPGEMMQLNDHLPLFLAAALIAIILVVLVMVIVFREPLRVWLFAKCGVRICETPCEDYEKLYDAVLLYSEKDYDLVSREIAAELEIRPPPLRLCLQHRDLSQDATYMHILESARASKRVVMLLSRNFMQTEWSRYEVRNAVHEALKERPQKLVILEEHDAAQEAERDLEMLPYIRSRVVNTIKLSDKHFWEKLRYALPAELQQTCNNYTLHQHERLPKPTAPPPSYYQQENDDANYSSATTATPSPRQSRRGGGPSVAPLSNNGTIGSEHGSHNIVQQQQQQPPLQTHIVQHQQQLAAPHSSVGGLHRPPSEHIYFSIESDYNGGIPGASAGHSATAGADGQPATVHRPQWRVHTHTKNSAQQPYMV